MSLEDTKKQSIKDAWLGIDFTDKLMINPTDIIKPNDPECHFKLMWLMTRPEYFSFLCQHVLNIQILPSQALILHEMWNRRFPMLIASRGFGKSFMLSLYSILRALILPKRKVVIVGAAFRQSKVLFEYMETIWNNAPMLRSMCSEESGPRREMDRCLLRINDSRVTCLPLGDGQKIRGQRANDIISDEFASIPRDIFETVVAGFAAVSSDPVGNVKRLAAMKRAAELGIIIEQAEKNSLGDQNNQIILSGTAYYDFNHFADYWKRWKSFINSRGNPARLQEIFGGGNVPKDFMWDEYSVIRIPYELLPDGFMDAAQVARSKATVHSGIYQMEYGATFTRDSQGFFKRSLIESCVCNEDDPVFDSQGEPIYFGPVLIGKSNRRYVFGIDPASEVDNFSIVILEIHADHRRVVHVWTTTRADHKEKIKNGYASETDFYSYCARKIRDLMLKFPCVHIALDAQGGGIAIEEALHDKDKLREGELPIWPIIDIDKEKDTDGHAGLHILELCQFAKADWLAEANHGLRKDFEDKSIVFPAFDGASFGISNIEDTVKGRMYDTLEECFMEIEDLKDELSIIQMTQTVSGRDRWDVPETIVGVGKKDRMRKDRYSSLIMANMAARIIDRTPEVEAYEFYGGFAGATKSANPEEENDYIGPSWFTEAMDGVYD
jgi:hypothetical protein